MSHAASKQIRQTIQVFANPGDVFGRNTESRSGSESGGAEQLARGRNWFFFSHTGGQHCQNLGRSSLGLEYLGGGFQSAQTREVFSK